MTQRVQEGKIDTANTEGEGETPFLESAALRMLDEAEELYGSAKAGRSVLYGDTHLDTLACMQRLAELQERRGKIEDAVGNFRLLIEKFDEELGREHPSTLEACMQAAMILREECPPEALCISNGEDTLAMFFKNMHSHGSTRHCSRFGPCVNGNYK